MNNPQKSLFDAIGEQMNLIKNSITSSGTHAEKEPTKECEMCDAPAQITDDEGRSLCGDHAAGTDCGKPHNNGEEEGCLECGVIRGNL